jgi:hypothetical protein
MVRIVAAQKEIRFRKLMSYGKYKSFSPNCELAAAVIAMAFLAAKLVAGTSAVGNAGFRLTTW